MPNNHLAYHFNYIKTNPVIQPNHKAMLILKSLVQGKTIEL